MRFKVESAEQYLILFAALVSVCGLSKADALVSGPQLGTVYNVTVGRDDITFPHMFIPSTSMATHSSSRSWLGDRWTGSLILNWLACPANILRSDPLGRTFRAGPQSAHFRRSGHRFHVRFGSVGLVCGTAEVGATRTKRMDSGAQLNPILTPCKHQKG